MIRKCFEQYFERFDVIFHNIVALKMSKALVEVDQDILVVVGYNKTALLILNQTM